MQAHSGNDLILSSCCLCSAAAASLLRLASQCKQACSLADQPDTHLQLCSAAACVQARKNLELVRGTKDVDKEFNDMVQAAHLAMAVKHPWKVRAGCSLMVRWEHSAAAPARRKPEILCSQPGAAL